MSHVTHWIRQPHPKSQRLYSKATELNNKNIYVLQIGANLCYKLGQVNYYKLKVFLQTGVAITN